MNDNVFHQELKNLLDDKSLIIPPDDLSPFCQDASRISARPCAVLQPRTTAQIAEIVRLAGRHHLPIAVRGGGTGLAGGAVATRGGPLISLQRMNRILEISPEDMIAVVQPGVTAAQLNDRLAPMGLLYPIDPAWQTRSTIGGNIATRAHGLRGTKYGRIDNYLLGLEAVVAPGEVIRGGARTLKCATGYHLSDLFAGSHGSIGIITEIILKLLPRPKARVSLMAAFRALDEALHVRDALRKEGIWPSRSELLDGPAAQIVCRSQGLDLASNQVSLFLELSGAEVVVHDDVRAVLKLFAEKGASHSHQAPDENQALNWWSARGRLLADLVENEDQALLLTTSLPPKKTSVFFQQMKTLKRSSSCRLTVYGHLGEERWHVVVAAPGTKNGIVGELVRMAQDVLRLTHSCGGLNLRPVGIGIAPPASIISPSDPVQADLWRRLKEQFDADNLFRPMAALAAAHAENDGCGNKSTPSGV